MSPENCGVFQLLREVIFRRILAFCNAQKWNNFGLLHARILAWYDYEVMLKEIRQQVF